MSPLTQKIFATEMNPSNNSRLQQGGLVTSSVKSANQNTTSAAIITNGQPSKELQAEEDIQDCELLDYQKTDW